MGRRFSSTPIRLVLGLIDQCGCWLAVSNYSALSRGSLSSTAEESNQRRAAPIAASDREKQGRDPLSRYASSTRIAASTCASRPWRGFLTRHPWRGKKASAPASPPAGPVRHGLRCSARSRGSYGNSNSRVKSTAAARSAAAVSLQLMLPLILPLPWTLIPLHAAEHRSDRRGRPAWMPVERCRARDGPSARYCSETFGLTQLDT